MARRNYGRRTYRRARSYGRRARSYGARGYRRARKANETIGLYNPGMEYAAGAAIGALTNLDDRIPAQWKIAAACLPLKGGIGGKVSRFARGICLGDTLQHSFNLPSLAGSAVKGNQLKGFGDA